MTIHIHVACDDEQYRSVIADFLDHQTGMEVVGASTSGIGAAAVEIADPDVVVIGIQSNGNVAQYAPRYRQMMNDGAAVVAFCMTPEQAREYRRLGIDHVILSDDPARNLTAAVRDAYSEHSAVPALQVAH